MQITSQKTFTQRLRGAMRADAATFAEVEHDRAATGQAALVVVAVAICSAIGNWGGGGPGMVGAVISALAGWFVWTGLTYLIADRFLGATATWGELLRTVGFAQAPGVFFVLAAVPFLGWFARLAISLWILVCVIVAIREALDIPTARAIIAAFLGWVAVAILSFLLMLGGAGPLAMQP